MSTFDEYFGQTERDRFRTVRGFNSATTSPAQELVTKLTSSDKQTQLMTIAPTFQAVEQGAEVRIMPCANQYTGHPYE